MGQKIVNPAILVIDVQNDFYSDKGLLRKRGFDISEIQKTTPKIIRFLKQSRRLGIQVIFVKSYYDKTFLPENVYNLYKIKHLENVCKSNSKGSQLYKIKPKLNEKVFIKHKYDAFTNPELERYLSKNNIKTIIFVGAQTDVCVDSTARSAFMKGYNIIAVEDCLASTDKDAHKKTLKYMEKYYNAQIRFSKQPLRRLKCAV